MMDCVDPKDARNSLRGIALCLADIEQLARGLGYEKLAVLVKVAAMTAGETETERQQNLAAGQYADQLSHIERLL